MPAAAPCEAASNVGVALLASIGNSIEQADAEYKRKTAVQCTEESLQQNLAANAKRVLLSSIEFEEIEDGSRCVFDDIKSRCRLLRPDSAAGESNGFGGHKRHYGLNESSNGAKINSNGIHDFKSNGIAYKEQHQGMPTQPQQHSTASISNPSELPTPKRVLYPREQIRLGWRGTTRRWQVGSGMTNVGNTCYLNSTLQALFHVPSLANWLISDKQHVETCDAGSNSCIICAMSETLKQSQSNTSSVRPFLVYTKLKMICKHMVHGRQEDAHEFLRFLVEAMEKAFLVQYRNHKDFDQYTKETTPINQILGGYLKSNVRCLSCSHVSVTFQHFQDVLLDIRRADSVDEALEGYFSRERLEDTGYKCEACKKKVSATKQFSLERAPIVLCLQLKRFSVSGSKIIKLITLRTRLDLTKYAAKKLVGGQQLTYRLVSMITHLGMSQHGGHYTAIGLTDGGTYYNFDDSHVQAVNVQRLCSTDAYVLFYELEQLNSVPNGGSRSTEVVAAAPSTQVSGKPNGILKPGTADYNRTCAPAVLKPRFIGPLMPQNGVKSSTVNGNALASPTSSPTKGTSYSNGNGLDAKTKINGVPQSNKDSVAKSNNSSCIEAFGEISDSDDDTNDSSIKKTSRPIAVNGVASGSANALNKLPLNGLPPSTLTKSNSLPHMPVLEPSGAEVLNHSPPSLPIKQQQKPQQVKSLVPYDSASEEEEPSKPQVHCNGKRNPLKRSSSESSSEHDGDLSAVTNGNAAQNGTPKCTKQTSICNFYPPISTVSSTSNKKPKTDMEESFNSAKKMKKPNTPSPPTESEETSPEIIKSKTGPWQVTATNDGELGGGKADYPPVKNTSPLKQHKNPFAVKTQTPPSDSKRPRSNGDHQREGQTPAPPNSVVSELLKQSHRGYGAPVSTWNGKPSEIDVDLAAESREQRERDYEHEQENDMDCGRQRKTKPHKDGASSYMSGYNPFQEQENQKRWYQQKGYQHKVIGVKHLANRFQHRNKYKARGGNRFAQNRSHQQQQQSQHQQQQQQQHSHYNGGGRDRHFAT